VLLHGGHGSWLHWVRNIDAMCEAGHAVLVPDMPGFGDSDALAGGPRAPDRLERLVDELDCCLDRLLDAGTRWDLAGFSFGGLVAANWVRRRPRIRRLALLGPAGHGSRRRPRAALQDWRLDDRAARVAALRHNLGAHMIADPHRIDELALAVHEASCIATRFQSKEISLKASLRDALRGADLPVMTIFGEHDVTRHARRCGRGVGTVGLALALRDRTGRRTLGSVRAPVIGEPRVGRLVRLSASAMTPGRSKAPLTRRLPRAAAQASITASIC
jgi:pimeloyl-ACP methyl ester carboxylesterase